MKLLSPYDAEDPQLSAHILAERRRQSMYAAGEITRRLAEEAEACAVLVGEVCIIISHHQHPNHCAKTPVTTVATLNVKISLMV